MAAVDRFEFLWKEIVSLCSNTRDALAFLGAFYASKKTLKCICALLKAGNDHVISKLSFLTDLRRRYGPWAVVTGSSEGIGKAYARELAKRGLNIILISKGENRLYRTAKEIENEFKVETCVIAVNFDDGRHIYNNIWADIHNKEIGILVNNVGVMYDFPQYFLDVPVDRLWQLVNVNVAAATMMTHLIMPQMVRRGRGAVVMVSAGACTQITPQMTVYAATKSFLDYFARALQYEYKHSGITIQSLMPFYVATRMTRFSKTLSKPSLLIPSAEVYAAEALSTLGYAERTTGYWPHSIQSWLVQCIPESLWKWGATRLNTALRKQADQRIRRRSLIKRDISDLSISSDAS